MPANMRATYAHARIRIPFCFRSFGFRARASGTTAWQHICCLVGQLTLCDFSLSLFSSLLLFTSVVCSGFLFAFPQSFVTILLICACFLVVFFVCVIVVVSFPTPPFALPLHNHLCFYFICSTLASPVSGFRFLCRLFFFTFLVSHRSRIKIPMANGFITEVQQ